MEQDKYDSVGSLLDDWKKQRKTYTVFCKDGILVKDDYDNAKPKIMFLLKETYKHFANICEPLGPGGTSKTF